MSAPDYRDYPPFFPLVPPPHYNLCTYTHFQIRSSKIMRRQSYANSHVHFVCMYVFTFTTCTIQWMHTGGPVRAFFKVISNILKSRNAGKNALEIPQNPQHVILTGTRTHTHTVKFQSQKPWQKDYLHKRSRRGGQTRDRVRGEGGKVEANGM